MKLSLLFVLCSGIVCTFIPQTIGEALPPVELSSEEGSETVDEDQAGVEYFEKVRQLEILGYESFLEGLVLDDRGHNPWEGDLNRGVIVDPTKKLPMEEEEEIDDASWQMYNTALSLIESNDHQDLAAGLRFLYLAVQKDASGDAPIALGICYFRGIGVRQDVKEALRWFSIAEETGKSRVIRYCLGLCREYGIEMPKDESEAVRLYKESATMGYGLAQERLACCYAQGKGVQKDETMAANWYYEAAKQGYTEAQREYGLCCLYGLGIPENRKEARHWLLEAADHGDVRAQNELRRLGIPFYPQIPETPGVAHLRRLASWEVYARIEMGKRCEEGKGVIKDIEAARRWYIKAAAQGCEEAEELLKKLPQFKIKQQ